MTKFTAEQLNTAQENGVSKSLLHCRVRSGWDVELAITTSPKQGNFSRKLERAVSWSSNRLLRCPVPGCTHAGNIITKAHCKMVHGMTREDVRKEYGMPYKIK